MKRRAKREVKQTEILRKKDEGATFDSNKTDIYRHKGQKQAAARYHNKCECLCKDALEILQEIVVINASLQV